MKMTEGPVLSILYEHPDWFRPLFQELERRGIPHRRVYAGEHCFEPLAALPPDHPPLVLNRMSPSAWKRGRGSAIGYTASYLAHLESSGVRVFNGARTFAYEISKALQVSLLGRLGVPAPRTIVVHDSAFVEAAASTLAFPILLKPNVGGSGAGIVRFDSAAQLHAAAAESAIPASLDGVLLVQEYHRPRGHSIVRVETLEGRFLYAIRIHLEDDGGFDLCPADICRTTRGQSLESAACPVGAQKTGLAVEAYEPPPDVVSTIERIAQAVHLDVGGIEYLESERDGARYVYDINALSNFVADPVRVVGFDPTARLVDALLTRAKRRDA
jgi:glutathione synthase/RimK-type ligase-like ATP-grasp enzyme